MRLSGSPRSTQMAGAVIAGTLLLVLGASASTRAGDRRTQRPSATSTRAASDRAASDKTDRPSAAPASFTMAFAGDVALNWRGTSPYLRTFPQKANPLRILAPLLRKADFAVANMEGVLMRHDPHYAEERLNLWAPWASAQIFAPAGIDLVSTANNHSFDGRDVGVLETLRHLRKAGVQVMGTGPTEAEARQPFVLRRPGGCVALIPATTKVNKSVRGRARVAWYPRPRQPELLRLVRDTRRRCAFVVVFIHWGREKVHRPPAKIRALAHALVEAGADLVVGHHPHVLQGIERFRQGVIVYSLGNFVFSNPNPETRRTALLWVTLSGAAPYRLGRVALYPVFIHRRQRYSPYPATPSQARDILRRLQSYSAEFGTQLVLRAGRIQVLDPAEITPP